MSVSLPETLELWPEIDRADGEELGGHRIFFWHIGTCAADDSDEEYISLGVDHGSRR